jgi:cell division protein FtsL
MDEETERRQFIERRQFYCQAHERHLDDVDDLQEKVASISGWQKALSFFIILCFVTVVSYASRTGVSVSKVQESVAKIDKQVATMVTSDTLFKRQTRKDIGEISERLGKIEREARASN